MVYYIYTAPHSHFERKINRPDVSTRTAYETTPTTIIKHVFHETKNEEVHIRIIILNLNA